ncbi:hypothetical protein M8C21_020043, partial [Ambrosia artemisiifolia]
YHVSGKKGKSPKLYSLRKSYVSRPDTRPELLAPVEEEEAVYLTLQNLDLFELRVEGETSYMIVPMKAEEKAARKRAKDESQSKISAELYKRCLNMHSSLRVLCDVGYIRALCSLNKEPSGIDDLHADIKSSFEEAVTEAFEWEHSFEAWWKENTDLDDYWANIHWNQIFTELTAQADYWEDVKNYALSLNISCNHTDQPTSGECIKRFFLNELLEPCLLGSNQGTRCRKIKEVCVKEYG